MLKHLPWSPYSPTLAPLPTWSHARASLRADRPEHRGEHVPVRPAHPKRHKVLGTVLVRVDVVLGRPATSDDLAHDAVFVSAAIRIAQLVAVPGVVGRAGCSGRRRARRGAAASSVCPTAASAATVAMPTLVPGDSAAASNRSLST